MRVNEKKEEVGAGVAGIHGWMRKEEEMCLKELYRFSVCIKN